MTGRVGINGRKRDKRRPDRNSGIKTNELKKERKQELGGHKLLPCLQIGGGNKENGNGPHKLRAYIGSIYMSPLGNGGAPGPSQVIDVALHTTRRIRNPCEEMKPRV